MYTGTSTYSIGLNQVSQEEYFRHHELLERLSPVPECKQDFDLLKTCPESVVHKLGMRKYENGYDLWLFPAAWYAHIPEGYEVVDVSGRHELFRRGITDDDRRFGLLLIGILRTLR
jgi:hypothetical protein